MSDGSLSQDEIDALLQGGGGFDLGGDSSSSGSKMSRAEIQEYSGLIAGSANSQGGNLSGMLGKSVRIGTPVVEDLSRDDFLSLVPDEVVAIQLNFTDGVVGDHLYVLPTAFANTVAGLMMGLDQVELDEAALSALSEAGNTLAGTMATTLGDKLGDTVMTAPGSTDKTLKASIQLPFEGFVCVTYPVTIEGEEPSQFYEIFSKSIVDALVTPAAPQASAGKAPAGASMGGGMGGGMGAGMPGMPGMGGMGMPPMGGMPGMGMPGMNPSMGAPMYGGYQQAPNVQQVQFPSLYPQGQYSEHGNIGLLMDVYMEMTVELGRTKRLIKEILSMGEGTIIELDKLAGEPVDILVNHKMIARGEVVVIDENFGVRVTEIVSQAERLGD